jgi:hypothetical protein
VLLAILLHLVQLQLLLLAVEVHGVVMEHQVVLGVDQLITELVVLERRDKVILEEMLED